MVSPLSAQPRLHRFCLAALPGWLPLLLRPGFESSSFANSSPFSSSVPWFFGPSLHRHYPTSSLLRPLLTSPPLSRKRSPQVRRRICSLGPPGSTECVLMTFGLCCCQPACRPHRASLPVRVPTVESLLAASFSFTSRLRLAVRYGCRHRPRLAPFIQLDSAHAGHTDLHGQACRVQLMYGVRCLTVIRVTCASCSGERPAASKALWALRSCFQQLETASFAVEDPIAKAHRCSAAT
jgi:hypothetical protein